MTELSRRGLFTWLLALIGWRPTFSPLAERSRRPWELHIDANAPYAPQDAYEAWEEWMRQRLDAVYRKGIYDPACDFDDLPITTRIAVYDVMGDLCDGETRNV